MSTFNAFYIRKKAADRDTRNAILDLYPKAQVKAFDDFIGAVLSSNDLEPPEQKLCALSAKLNTDVIWLTFQTTAGSFIYHHWQNGSHLRALMYGCKKDGQWDRVEGQAEEWETECFWDEESLEMNLEEAKSDAERKRLKKLWKDGVLIEGSELPIAGDDTAVEAVMEYYGLEY
ncbi:MAG: hypothetical protein H7144_08815 [Burkholderiales bacterium]|nr:hypothetical protein [Phycisphaerae bacterium]